MRQSRAMPSPVRVGLWLLVVLHSAQPLAAQRFSGSYTTTDAEGAPATLVLREIGGGAVSGSFTHGRVAYRVDARVVDDLLSGSMRGSSGELYFEAERTSSDLWLTLWGIDALGEPDEEDFVELAFTLDGAAPPRGGVDPGAGGSPPPGGSPGTSGNPLGGGNPLSGSISDPYSGYFTDGNVALELWGGGGQYEGQIVVGGASYPVRAAGGTGGIQGTLESANGSYPITGQLQGGVLVVVSGGVRYYLYRDVLGRPGSQYGQYGPGGVGSDPAGGRGVRPGGVGLPPGPGARPGFTEQHIMAREWLVFLSGRTVRRLISDTGRGGADPGDRLDVSLCSDRTFTTRAGSRPSAVPGRAPAPSAGRWSVVSDGEVALLLLYFREGPVLEFRMHFADRLPYANGSRIQVAPASGCR